MGAHCEEIREETEMANLVVFPKWLAYYPGFQRIIFSYRCRNGPREPGYYHIGKREEFYMTPIIFLERLLTNSYYVTSAKREVTKSKRYLKVFLFL